MPYNKLEFPVIASIKYDGRNTEIVKTGSIISYFTSGGKKFKLENNEPFNLMEDGVYFAEMMGQGYEGKLGDRKHSGVQTTMFTNTSKGIKNNHKPEWRIFNYVSLADYNNKQSNVKYEDMVAHLLAQDSYIPGTPIMRTRKCHNMSELMDYYNEKIEDGWEGLMVAQPDLKWKDSTSRLKTLVKMKEVPTIKGLVVGIKLGTGKYEDMIGSLDIKLQDGTMFNVGSGLTDFQRQLPHHQFIDEIVEVAYEQMMNGVPQQPRFKGVRDAF